MMRSHTSTFRGHMCKQEVGCTRTIGAQDNIATNEGRCACALPYTETTAQHDMLSDKKSEPKGSISTCVSRSPTTSDRIASEQEETAKRGPKPGRKVGRPILYTGDPHDPGLNSLERRTIVRRLANRESARRVRLRRQDHLQRLEDEVRLLREANSELSVQNKYLRDDRDSRRSYWSRVPRTGLLPSLSTQEDTGFHKGQRKTENSGTDLKMPQWSGSAEWDGCFELIPSGFPGPVGLFGASAKRREF